MQNQKKYTKMRFAAELILALEETLSTEEIADWANQVYLKHVGNMEEGLEDILQDISAMSLGEQFEMTKEELKKISVELIGQ